MEEDFFFFFFWKSEIWIYDPNERDNWIELNCEDENLDNVAKN